MNTMANNVADLKAETLKETPANVQAEVLLQTKADTLKNIHAWTLGNKLLKMLAEAVK